jgi:hypothetical protein
MSPYVGKMAENSSWMQKTMNPMTIEEHSNLMEEIPLALQVLVAVDERKLEMVIDLQEAEMVVDRWVELDEQREIAVLDNAGRGVRWWVGHMLLVKKPRKDH